MHVRDEHRSDGEVLFHPADAVTSALLMAWWLSRGLARR